jgi:hypothetical protein
LGNDGVHSGGGWFISHSRKEEEEMKGFVSFCYNNEHGDTLSILQFFPVIPTERQAKYFCGKLLAKELSKNWEGFEEDFVYPSANEVYILEKLAKCLNPSDPAVKGWKTYEELLESYLRDDWNAVFLFGPIDREPIVKWSE